MQHQDSAYASAYALYLSIDHTDGLQEDHLVTPVHSQQLVALISMQGMVCSNVEAADLLLVRNLSLDVAASLRRLIDNSMPLSQGR